MSRGLGAIFVGGRSTRMGGKPKGLLLAPSGEPIIERTLRILRSVDLDVALLGDATSYARYTGEGCPAIADDPAAQGPLSGLIAAFQAVGDGIVFAVGCDMPLVNRALLLRMLDHETQAPILAPKRDGRFEPLFARYDAAGSLTIAKGRANTGDFSLQRFLVEARAEEFPLQEGEASTLTDWDSPEDVATHFET